MNAPKASFAGGAYGAFELKRYYQRSMAMGFLIAAFFHVAVVGSFVLYQYIVHAGDDDIPVIRISTLSEIAAPPSMTQQKPQIAVAEPDIAPPSIGIPTPVPDEEVIEEVRFATRAELAELSAPIVSASDDGRGGDVIVDIEDYFPAYDKFVPVEEMPVVIKGARPEYPEIAELTGTEGRLIIQALITKEGTVKDVRIAKPSGSNVGFDEAAVEAAYKFLYKPAIQNGQPVAVWVTYPVIFKLKD